MPGSRFSRSASTRARGAPPHSTSTGTPSRGTSGPALGGLRLGELTVPTRGPLPPARAAHEGLLDRQAVSHRPLGHLRMARPAGRPSLQPGARHHASRARPRPDGQGHDAGADPRVARHPRRRRVRPPSRPTRPGALHPRHGPSARRGARGAVERHRPRPWVASCRADRHPGQGQGPRRLATEVPLVAAGLGAPGLVPDDARGAAHPAWRAPDGPVFADALGGYRDRNNVGAAFRRARAGTEYEWVTPHTFRKTVATLLDSKGASARMIADQLGHSRISMTQDVYMGRRAVSPELAVALESPRRRPASAAPRCRGRA